MRLTCVNFPGFIFKISNREQETKCEKKTNNKKTPLSGVRFSNPHRTLPHLHPEELSERSGSHGIHRTGLKIHKDSSGNVTSSSGLVVVHVDSLQLKVGVSVVGSRGVDSVLVGDDFPEFGTDFCLYCFLCW